MKVAALSLMLLAAAGSAGCAIRTSDAQGRVTTLGFVWSTQPGPLPPVGEPAHERFVLGRELLPGPPRWIELRAAGVIFENTPNNLGVTLGYKDSIWVFPMVGALTEAERSGRGEPVQLNVSQP